MHDEFNCALKQSQPYQTILYSDSQNHIGIYYQKRKVKNRMVSFYYISKDMLSRRAIRMPLAFEKIACKSN